MNVEDSPKNLVLGREGGSEKERIPRRGACVPTHSPSPLSTMAFTDSSYVWQDREIRFDITNKYVV